MPRYFLHLRDSFDEVLDPEGMILPEEAIAGAALFCSARLYFGRREKCSHRPALPYRCSCRGWTDCAHDLVLGRN